MIEYHVSIDIKPGKDPNVINIRSNGLVPVALLGSAEFDVSQMDTSTVAFGRMHEAGTAAVKFSSEDVNKDGFRDLVFGFKTREIGLQPGDTEACLHVSLVDGTFFCGHDAVIVIG